ncbi:MAG: zeta toxin family protein [Chthoniobacterales bacterium]
MSFATLQKLIKPSLVVIAGPNGSGKTAITKIIHENCSWINGLIEVNPDNIAQQEFGGWNDLASIKKAARRADEIREQCLVDRQSLLFETVLSIPEKVDYIRRAKMAGYFVRLIYVATENPEINMLRVSWRVNQGGHTVPIDKIRSRYERSLKMVIEVAHIVDRAYFVDNSKDCEDATDMVNPLPIFRMVDGVVAKKYLKEEDFPEWTKKIHDALTRRNA